VGRPARPLHEWALGRTRQRHRCAVTIDRFARTASTWCWISHPILRDQLVNFELTWGRDQVGDRGGARLATFGSARTRVLPRIPHSETNSPPRMPGQNAAVPIESEALRQLASEPSPHSRTELVRSIAAAFFAGPQRSTKEVGLFDEIMDRVLAEVEPLARRELAERLADLTEAPQRTLVRLAGDAIEVAEPVLSRSPCLRDEHLETIARGHSQAHLLAIARRKALSERLTDILVDRGNDEVAGTVTDNEGARLSEAGFDRLALRASASVTLLNRLVLRSDLPERIANDLVPVMAKSIAEKIAATPWDTEFSVRRLLDEARALLADRLRAAATCARSLAVLTDQVARGNMTVSEAALELANADEIEGLASLIGKGLRIQDSTVVRNLFLGGEQTLMLMCKAAALDTDAFYAILRTRNRQRRSAKLNTARLVKEYPRIPRALAVNVIRAVREREQR
jgi:uncharacterized protein (DUF2336 family)